MTQEPSHRSEQLLSSGQLDLTITRLAHELIEAENSLDDLVYIGVQPRGIFLSDRIVEETRRIHPGKLLYGKLDITFYRDDFRTELHKANQTDIPFSIENKKVILIDDVLYTGRTIRAALDALQDFGRPRQVKLCVLVDRRFNRELPIQADYYGMSIDSLSSQKVKVLAATNEVILYS
jgi:pyrimidine operon attenuation protein / uracil phosphoribosyltransferase